MARQKGPILLTGQVDNLSYYKMNGKHFVRRKSGVSRDRLMSDAVYERTRENIAIFGQASLAAKLLRSAVSGLVREGADYRISSRLTGAMVKVVQSGQRSNPDQHSPAGGMLTMLEGFEFNKYTPLPRALNTPFKTSVDRPTGTAAVVIPVFNPRNTAAPAAATHIRLSAAAATVDFINHHSTTSLSRSEDIALRLPYHHAIHLSLTLPPASPDPIFLLLGVTFITPSPTTFHHDNDNRESNALAIVHVDAPDRIPTPSRP